MTNFCRPQKSFRQPLTTGNKEQTNKQSMNRNSYIYCSRQSWQPVRDRSQNGWQPIKSIKNPLLTSLVGYGFLMPQQKSLADQNALTKSFRGCKMVGDWSLRICCHIPILAVCYCHAYAKVHTVDNVPRKPFYIECRSPSQTDRQPVRERSTIKNWRPIKDRKNLLSTNLVVKRFSMQLLKPPADQNV